MLEFGKCDYCGSQVQYDPETATYIKCTGCGRISHITAFEQVRQRIQAQLEAGKAAQAALRQAEEEKKAAQAQLGDAVSALAGIQACQEEGEKALEALLAGQKDSRADQQAMAILMQSARTEQREGQALLTELLQAAIRNQETGEGKLEALRGLAGDILQAKDDVAALVQACTRHVQAGKDELNTLIGKLFSWSQQAHRADSQRLSAILQVTNALQDSVRGVDRKVEGLQKTAGKTLRALDDFRGAWEKYNLNELVELYHQAKNFQRDRQFDQAEEYYRKVLIQGGKDAEVYWRLVLCHYCVVYLQDHGKSIPTVLNPDLSDPDNMSVRRDFSMALDKMADAEQKRYYLQEMDAIDRILDAYREIWDRVCYDVFISVKQEDGGRFTRDSDKASTLYDLLTSWGLKVFNSRRTPPPAGENYEPYIIAALHSAKVMIVVGTKPEYMNAPWVRNEWERFSWLEKHDRDAKRLLFCYLADGMEAKDIPKGLSPNRQAVIENAMAESVLKRNLRAFFPEEPKQSKKEYTVRWLNGDGSTLDQKTFTEDAAEPKTEKTPVKAAERGCTYAFSEWDAGDWQGSVKTYRPIFRKNPKANPVRRCLNGHRVMDPNALRCPSCGIRMDGQETAKCPICSTFIDENAKKCPVCGKSFVAPADPVRYCPNQHKNSRLNTPFCETCGIRIDGSDSKQCPKCNQYIKKTLDQCPHCGFSFMPPAPTCTCPNGHETTNLKAKQCPTCGIRMDGKDTVECPVCHTYCVKNAKQCPQCGALLPRKRKKMARIIFLIIFVLLFIGLCRSLNEVQEKRNSSNKKNTSQTSTSAQTLLPTSTPTRLYLSTPTPTRNPSPTPTKRPSPTPTRRPSPTPTKRPEPTPTRRPSPTPTPAPANITGKTFPSPTLGYTSSNGVRTGVRIQWKDLGNGVTYTVYRRYAKADNFGAIQDAKGIKTHEFTDPFPVEMAKQRTEGYTYYYYIVAKDRYGNTNTSDTAKIKIQLK